MLAYLLLAGLLYLVQSRMIYHPVRTIYQTPETIGISYEEVSFTTDDNQNISGWFVPADRGRGTILFSHGNAGNISGRLETLRILHSLGMNVLMYDYRGYGKSEGDPTEQGTYLDVQAAWHYLVNNKKIPGDQILLMGRSLGGAVSAWLASRVEPAGLILESTFTSAPDLAAELYPMFPARWLVKYRYPTIQYVREINMPLLINHSTDDGLVSYHHGKALYEAASDPKRFFTMQGDHGSGHISSGKSYIQALDDFIGLAIQR